MPTLETTEHASNPNEEKEKQPRPRSQTTGNMSNPDEKEENTRPRSKTAPTNFMIKASQHFYFYQLLSNKPDTAQKRHFISPTAPKYKEWLEPYCKLVIVNSIEKAVQLMISQARTKIVKKEQKANYRQNVIKDIEKKVIEHILHNKKQLGQVVKNAIVSAVKNPQQLLENCDPNEPMDNAQGYLREFSDSIQKEPWLNPKNTNGLINMLSNLRLMREANESSCTLLELLEDETNTNSPSSPRLFNNAATSRSTTSTPENETKPKAMTKGS